MALGVLLGVRHAFEPDHLTAISTLVVDARDTRRAILLGTLWGAGHTLSLVVVGVTLLLAGGALPARLALAFELAVAVMLVVLGARSIIRALRVGELGSVRAHRHASHIHEHACDARHVHVAGKTLALRPLFVGIIHGLAGSGAVTAIVFAELPTMGTRITYIALFGVGSTLGMAFTSGIAGASIHRVTTQPSRQRALALATGTISIVVGIAWAVPQLAAL
jgi:ABC-type nickel/cobalt efflux system permease component RcnA